jgi:outer membrane protein assembly factor BamB
VPVFDLNEDPVKFANKENQPGDWPQWAGSSIRNNTPNAKNIPTEWDIGEFDDNGEWKTGSGKNIKWVARLGSQSYGNPTVANGHVYVGTNNGKGYVKRFPPETDLGCLLCFDTKDGKFLWQDSNTKLPAGRVVDWPQQGICSTSCVEGNRLWYVSSRGEVKCLDTQGFYDGVNNGPYKKEPNEDKDEADAIWVVNMMKQWGTSQHNMCACSVTIANDTLFVCTGNGVDEAHISLPAPYAPSFVAMNKNTGKVYWKDNTPGTNVLHGQWSSPAFAIIEGVPQVIFGGGDGWLYGFDARGDGHGHSKILWKFDANPKTARYVLGGRSNRNHIIATPVIYNNKVYFGVGEDPEHGEGIGHLYCVDPTKRGDISIELAVKRDDPQKKPIPIRRNQAVMESEGEIAIPNPNSGAVWHYAAVDTNGNGKIDFEETMHRTCGTVCIKNDLLYVADFSGLFHCLDAKTGKVHWTHDLKACSWASPLIVEDRVYIGNEDGVVTIFKLSDKEEKISEVNMGAPVYSTPIVADNVLYISTQNYLYAIQNPADAKK